ncbi:HIT domain-containing protein [Candidatus Giovannonibacteria bacterium]|nr:HIT domain-containing protein [Candidatus Giovannonibacteria bacterium]
MKKNLIEFRKDIVSGDWVLISATTQKKPIFFKPKDSTPLSQDLCPFDNPAKSGQESPLLWLPKPKKNDIKDWWVQIFPNKFPVVMDSRVCPPLEFDGKYHHKTGVGFQEVVVTRDHKRHIGLMKENEIVTLVEAYTARYQALRAEPCVEYILIFHNNGARAGASVPHPHSQILAIPIIPPDVARSLRGSDEYHKKNKKCVHCDIIKWEIKEKKRIIFENDLFVAIAPFASKVAFEIRIFPKIHESRFEVIDEKQKETLAHAMQTIFYRIFKKLKNPDYNFFIHTLPPKDKNGGHYHWHIEVLPRLTIWGGLELGAGIEVVKFSPEEASKFLRK